MSRQSWSIAQVISRHALCGTDGSWAGTFLFNPFYGDAVGVACSTLTPIGVVFEHSLRLEEQR